MQCYSYPQEPHFQFSIDSLWFIVCGLYKLYKLVFVMCGIFAYVGADEFCRAKRGARLQILKEFDKGGGF